MINNRNLAISLTTGAIINFIIAILVGYSTTDIFIVWFIATLSNLYTTLNNDDIELDVLNEAAKVCEGKSTVHKSVLNIYRRRSVTLNSVCLIMIITLILAIIGEPTWIDVSINTAIAMVTIYLIGLLMYYKAIGNNAKSLYMLGWGLTKSKPKLKEES